VGVEVASAQEAMCIMERLGLQSKAQGQKICVDTRTVGGVKESWLARAGICVLPLRAKPRTLLNN